MKEIISLLGLKENATEEQIVKNLEKRLAAHDEAVETIEQFKAAAKGIPKTVNPEALAEKLRAGLGKEQAIEVLAKQAAHDKAKPHDAAPKSKE